ncbi:dihydrolipoyl dehydrogenase [uncultured Anaerococcus sp.]|uniref:dihydrolipoyl dehydrogenase n=1 Tax=uncultured Anaerococcus sp. TaxID=293428 RepID=UPI002604AA27|nr:dihydrolipoyl dehydrogenase [uncultured Anaerococcus sp.]
MVEIKVPIIPGKKPNIVGKIDVDIGQKVEEDQVLCQIETGKGNRQIKSTMSGYVKEIIVEEGQKVESNEILILIDENMPIKANENIKNVKEIHNHKINDSESIVEKDLLVIGAGPGGYVAAIYASKRGLDVGLVEKNKLGGTCLNIGCIPTKSMVESAHFYDSLKQMNEFGIEGNFDAYVNIEKVCQRKNDVVDTLVSGIDYLINKNGIEFFYDQAEFINDKLVKVGNKTIKAKNIIIATGSNPNTLEVESNNLDGVIDSTEALNLKEIPENLLVIGGGVIGLEFAFIYNSFGSNVHVVEFQDRLLPMFDYDAGDMIEKVCKENNIHINTSSKVVNIRKTVENKYIVDFEKESKLYSSVADKVLMATGRKANIDGLGIENTSININEKSGDIIVNEYKQTNLANIYAIGDVSSKLKLAHLASQEALLAVDHIFGEKRLIKDIHVPSVVYTHPEIAIVGYSEEDLKNKDIKYKLSKFDFIANGKALTMNQNKGFIKILASENDEILGTVICGPDASTLISSITIAMTNNISVKQLTQTVFAHPTTAEVIHEATLDLIGRGVHM